MATSPSSSIDVLSAVERKHVVDALELAIASAKRAAKTAKSPAIAQACEILASELSALQVKFR